MVIATYALCGFSNVGSIGIMLGALGAMAPTRKQDLTKVVVRAMICGNVACFLTACIAGKLSFTHFSNYKAIIVLLFSKSQECQKILI